MNTSKNVFAFRRNVNIERGSSLEDFREKYFARVDIPSRNLRVLETPAGAGVGGRHATWPGPKLDDE